MSTRIPRLSQGQHGGWVEVRIPAGKELLFSCPFPVKNMGFTLKEQREEQKTEGQEGGRSFSLGGGGGRAEILRIRASDLHTEGPGPLCGHLAAGP